MLCSISHILGLVEYFNNAVNFFLQSMTTEEKTVSTEVPQENTGEESVELSKEDVVHPCEDAAESTESKTKVSYTL